MIIKTEFTATWMPLIDTLEFPPDVSIETWFNEHTFGHCLAINIHDDSKLMKEIFLGRLRGLPDFDRALTAYFYRWVGQRTGRDLYSNPGNLDKLLNSQER